MERTRLVMTRTAVVVLVFIASLAALARANNEAFSFAVTADSRGHDSEVPVNIQVLTRIFTDMNTFAPEFCLFPGDLVFGGIVDNHVFMRQLRAWIDTASNYKGPVYPTPGNHEMKHWPGRDDAWNQLFPSLPSNGPGKGPRAGNYFFDYRGSRFISVLSDHEDGHIWIDQKWLDQILDDSSGFKHIFVMSHHPMEQLGGAEGEFWQSLRRHHVDAYFCGHWHLYNRSQPEGSGTWQIIFATAGAPPAFYFPLWMLNGTTIPGKYGFGLMKVNDSSVEVTFYSNIEGQEKYTQPLDHFIISNSEEHPNTYSELKDRIVMWLTSPWKDNRPPTAERTHSHQTPLPSGG